jgi:hypothetical protein
LLPMYCWWCCWWWWWWWWCQEGNELLGTGWDSFLQIVGMNEYSCAQENSYDISCKKHADQRTTLTALQVMLKTFKKGLTVTIWESQETTSENAMNKTVWQFALKEDWERTWLHIFIVSSLCLLSLQYLVMKFLEHFAFPKRHKNSPWAKNRGYGQAWLAYARDIVVLLHTHLAICLLWWSFK